MTYETSITNTSRRLASLLTHGGRVPAIDLPIALVARDTIMIAFLEIYSDATAGAAKARSLRHNHESLAAAVGAHPVAGLRALATSVRPAPFPDARPGPPVSAAAGLWADAALQASTTQLAWGNRDRDSDWPTRGGWSIVAECASIIEAVGLLDADLDLDRRQHLTPLVRMAATDVRRLATSADLPPLDALPAAIERPVRVTNAREAAAGMDRLAQLIDRADHLGPLGIGVLAQTTARLATRLASLTGRADLNDHARVLAQASGRSSHLVSIRTASPAALVQAQQLAYLLRLADERAGIRSNMSPAADWEPVAHRVPVVTRALERAASRELHRGAWLVAVPTRGDRFQWQVTSDDLEPPRLVAALRAAERHARLLPTVARDRPASRVVDLTLVEAAESRLHRRPLRPVLAPQRGISR